MSYSQLYGCKFYVSAVPLAAAKTITSVSNTAPPVVSSTAHGYSDNDEVVIFNQWDFLKSTIVRVSASGANQFTVAGYDTTDTNFYPAAGSAGTMQKVASWLPMGQILGFDTQGGDASFDELTPFDSFVGVKIFKGFSGASFNITLGWDRNDSTQQSMQLTSRTAGKRGIKIALPGGGYCYGYGTLVSSPLPKFESVIKQSVAFTLDGIATVF